MAGTTRTILTDFSAAAVKTAIETARAAVSLPAFQVWQEQLDAFPISQGESWEDWLKATPTPFGVVLLGDETTEERFASGRRQRAVQVYMVISVTATTAIATHQAMADTEDSTVKGVETALAATYFTIKSGYPLAVYQGCTFLPYEGMRADQFTGLLTHIFQVQALRSPGIA